MNFTILIDKLIPKKTPFYFFLIKKNYFSMELNSIELLKDAVLSLSSSAFQ